MGAGDQNRHKEIRQEETGVGEETGAWRAVWEAGPKTHPWRGLGGRRERSSVRRGGSGSGWKPSGQEGSGQASDQCPPLTGEVFRVTEIQRPHPFSAPTSQSRVSTHCPGGAQPPSPSLARLLGATTPSAGPGPTRKQPSSSWCLGPCGWWQEEPA